MRDAEKTIRITGMSENMGRDGGIKEAFWVPLFLRWLFVVNITKPSDCSVKTRNNSPFFISRLSTTVRVNGVLNRTVVDCG